MKIYKFLMAFLMILPFLESCQNDITDLEDPRDAIAKQWRVTDDTGPTGEAGYDVTISKDATELTRVLFTNFHGVGSTDKLYATLAGLNLTIPHQTLDNVDVFEGSGVISSDLKTITFNYTYDDGNTVDPINVVGTFAEPNVTKKKTVKVTVPLQ